MYAITITTKDAEVKLMHDVFKLKCEEFMKQQYKNREYKLFYEYGNHSTGFHAHGTINTHFLPKNNKLNQFYVHIRPIDDIVLWDAYIQKDIRPYQIYGTSPFLDE